ncbi:putative acetyltransferase [Aquibacillus albus]|uniref:Acetyltransferase n=1 Tax=Aquibacillus albus TaxID=1168171 RepID=A0ABS2N0A7_9BACI|nr:putative acetyltransferase [Aquibacillus albus]
MYKLELKDIEAINIEKLLFHCKKRNISAEVIRSFYQSERSQSNE